jgi:hypothetical protein
MLSVWVNGHKGKGYKGVGFTGKDFRLTSGFWVGDLELEFRV